MIFGVDEVGRGPLAGPVVACAVLAGTDLPRGVRDSKSLTPGSRLRLDGAIRAAVPVALGEASVAEIDALNILQATLLAMARAVEALAALLGAPALVRVDGNRVPPIRWPAEAIVGGDASVPEIAAASIVAKVARDAIMVRLGEAYPAYGFARHMGYPTRDHLAALARCGPCAEHRRSFRPVRKLLDHESFSQQPIDVGAPLRMGTQLLVLRPFPESDAEDSATNP
jgi:ribonuclease HII